jgi:hypothetical protein
MSTLLRRLRKLEAQLTDHSGLMPHTKPWSDYWSPRIDDLIAGETLDQKVPLEVIDALIHGAELDGESSFFIGESKRI